MMRSASVGGGEDQGGRVLSVVVVVVAVVVVAVLVSQSVPTMCLSESKVVFFFACFWIVCGDLISFCFLIAPKCAARFVWDWPESSVVAAAVVVVAAAAGRRPD